MPRYAATMPRYHDDDDEDHIDMRPLLRIGVWGAGAVVAVVSVLLAGRTEVGAERAQVALAALRQAPREIVAHPSNLLAARSSSDDAATKRLTDEVSKLTADRDRLVTRVATLEQNLTDLTGSIARAEAPAANGASAPTGPAGPRTDDKSEAFPPPAPNDLASTSSSNGDTRSIAPSIAPPADQPSTAQAPAVPMPRPGRMATIQSYVTSAAPPPAAGGSESRVAATSAETAPPADTPPNGYAIDLGTATNVNTLRAHWGSVNRAHAAMLGGLRPLVSVRHSTRPGFTEFHLVAGPVADADAAARLCQALASVRVQCRPSTFDGQRLDLR
jgi:hypothetical protein